MWVCANMHAIHEGSGDGDGQPHRSQHPASARVLEGGEVHGLSMCKGPGGQLVELSLWATHAHVVRISLTQATTGKLDLFR